MIVVSQITVLAGDECGVKESLPSKRRQNSECRALEMNEKIQQPVSFLFEEKERGSAIKIIGKRRQIGKIVWLGRTSKRVHPSFLSSKRRRIGTVVRYKYSQMMLLHPHHGS